MSTVEYKKNVTLDLQSKNIYKFSSIRRKQEGYLMILWWLEFITTQIS